MLAFHQRAHCTKAIAVPLVDRGNLKFVFPTIPYSSLTQLNAVEETLQRRKCLHSITEVYLNVDAGVFETALTGGCMKHMKAMLLGAALMAGTTTLAVAQSVVPVQWGWGQRDNDIQRRVASGTRRCAAQSAV